jgi:RNA-dependent RNA polymerase
LKLGDLHSDAVDYPKSGQPVSLDKIPRLKFRARPDWNAPETVMADTENFYESTKAIGKLFRSIELPSMGTAKRAARKQERLLHEGHEFTVEEILAAFHLDDTNTEEDIVRTAVEERVRGFIETRPLDEETINYVSHLFNRYASELRMICATHTLSHARSAMLTEEEAMIGTIVAKCSQPRKRKDLMAKLREQTNLLVTSIREDLVGDEDLTLEDGLMRAWVAWELSAVERDAFGGKTFGWVALGGIFEVIKDIGDRDGLEGSRF